jgi:hypothetical protein
MRLREAQKPAGRKGLKRKFFWRSQKIEAESPVCGVTPQMRPNSGLNSFLLFLELSPRFMYHGYYG